MASWARMTLIVVSAMCWASLISAQVIFVDPIEKDSSGPTPTFLWTGKDAKAVLIMIPGGDGHLGLTPERTDLGGFYGNTLKRLSDPSLTSGSLDVVVFDSPDQLAAGDVYPTSRTTPDHLSRIESVVRYYKDKFNKPVWLMGHSNGGVSVTEFWKYIHGTAKEDLIAGIVISSSRIGITFPDNTNIPVLFMHHLKDNCPKADASASENAYESLKSTDKSKVAFVWIKGGEADGGRICYSGYHMYYGAGEEAANAIDGFITN